MFFFASGLFFSNDFVSHNFSLKALQNDCPKSDNLSSVTCLFFWNFRGGFLSWMYLLVALSLLKNHYCRFRIYFYARFTIILCHGHFSEYIVKDCLGLSYVVLSFQSYFSNAMNSNIVRIFKS